MNFHLIIFGLISVFCLICIPSQSQAKSLHCPYKKPNINFNATISPVEYITTVPVSDLTHMHKNHTGAAPGKTWVGGLGGGKMGMEYRTTYRMATLGEEACLYVDEISAQFYAHPQVHVASNFKQGTCEYRAVLEHESKHIEVFKRAYRQNSTKLRSTLRSMGRKYKVTGPIHVSELDSAKLRIEREIEERIRELNDKLMDDLERRQAQVDTPEEYERVARQCRNWTQKINGHYSR